MNKEALDLLTAADDPEAVEHPRGFNYLQEMAAVEQIKPEIEAIVGRPLDIDTGVQDATFFTDLAILLEPKYVVGFGNVVFRLFVVRFSSFGRLFTVTSSGDETLDEAVIHQAIDAIQRHGYRYIAEEDVGERYTGNNRHFQGRSWWIRFFDYTG